MSRTKEVGTAAGTLACALGIGFIMQSTDVAEQRYGATADVRQTLERSTQPVISEIEIAPLIDVQDITLTSALSPSDAEAAVRSVRSAVSSVLSVPERDNLDIVREAMRVAARVEGVEQSSRVEVLSCDVVATATPMTNAFVALTLFAPCHGGQDVSIHHNGMLFSDRLDATGNLEVKVPALSQSAAFIFTLDDGEGAIATSKVDDIQSYRRIVLQWQGQSGFELHAREFGADYGSDGHVWRNAKATTERLSSGQGGILTELGSKQTDRLLLAEVYSFPADLSDRKGEIDLSVETEITQANCGQEIEAQTLELRGAEGLRTQSLMLTIPGCDSVGDFLVLNNLLEDLKIAAR